MISVLARSLLQFLECDEILGQYFNQGLFEHIENGGKLAGLHKSFISFQTLRLKIHERQSSCDTMFFSN